jgi:hypothetical protein
VNDSLANLKVPTAPVPRAAAILEITDGFCADHLDLEYAELCRRLVGRLGRKRPSPLQRGNLLIWAGAIVHTIGSLNFLFDPSHHPHLSASEMCRQMDVSQATAANKSSEIRNLLRVAPFDPELSRRAIEEQSPFRNLVEVAGLVVPVHLFASIDDDEDEA